MDEKKPVGTPSKESPGGPVTAASPQGSAVSPSPKKLTMPVLSQDKMMLAVHGVIPGDKRHMPIHKWDVGSKVQLKSLLVSWAQSVLKKQVTKIPDGVRVLGAHQEQIVDFNLTLGELRRKFPLKQGRLTIQLLWPNDMEDPAEVAAKAEQKRKAAAEKKAIEENKEKEQKAILKKLRDKEKMKEGKSKDKEVRKKTEEERKGGKKEAERQGQGCKA